MQVDETGQQDEPVRVDALGPGGVGRGITPDGGDDAVADEEVGGVAAEEAGAGDEQVAQAARPASL